MASAPAVTGAFSNLYDQRFRKNLYDAYMRQPPQWQQIAKVETEGKRHSILEGNGATFGQLLAISEGGATPLDSMDQGNSKEVFFTNYALGFMVTEDMADDDQFNVLSKAPQELGKSANYTNELVFWDQYNGAFVTTTRSALDGIALCGTHLLLDSADTLDNAGSGALSASTLQTALDFYRNMENERGIPIVMKPDLLIIPPELVWMAKKLLLSEYNPAAPSTTGQMLMNPYKDEGLSYMVVNFLTSTTAWFLVSKSDLDTRFIWRRKLMPKSYDDPNTDSRIYKAKMRIAADFWEWRGVYGSPGT